MRIEQVDLADTEKIRACHEVNLAADRIDTPEGPWLGDRAFRDWMTLGWGGDPREVWVAPAQGPVAGWYRLELPDRENLDRARLNLVVHPSARRHGIGRALLRHAAARTAGHGRSVLAGGAPYGSPGEAFARSAGAEPGLVEIKRVLEPGQLAEGTLARLHEPAERAAAGYSLVSWTGLVPDEFIEQAAALYTALNDAPHSPGVTPEAWDAQRVRRSVNGLRRRFGMRHYSIAGRHDASGELAALTEMAVDPADPGWGHQLITAVTRKHRGHRLGLLVKIAMLDLLATAEPQLERIVTWNAQANKHMIAVNEALGYTILGPPSTSYRVNVPPLPG
jgi:GNAT superfamily N-acetyltransferase